MANCYNPDGSLITGVAYQPCNQFKGAVSTCCGTNHTGPIAPDVCLTNGLCQNTGDKVFWRQGCTDKTWKSPFCLSQLCTTSESGGGPKVNQAVGQCADGSWCCGGKNTTCCNAKAGVFLAATIGVSSTISSSRPSTLISTSSSSSTSTTTTSSATATNTPPPSSSSGLSTGAKAGIGIGAALGILAILGVLAFICLRKRRAVRGSKNVVVNDHAGIAYHEVDGTNGRKQPGQFEAEMSAYRSPVEAPTNTPADTHRAELPS